MQRMWERSLDMGIWGTTLTLSLPLTLPSSCESASFRAGVKDLEVMTQNLMTSAFESVRDVERGVEIQDIFHHLSVREV